MARCDHHYVAPKTDCPVDEISNMNVITPIKRPLVWVGCPPSVVKLSLLAYFEEDNMAMSMRNFLRTAFAIRYLLSLMRR